MTLYDKSKCFAILEWSEYTNEWEIAKNLFKHTQVFNSTWALQETTLGIHLGAILEKKNASPHRPNIFEDEGGKTSSNHIPK